MKLSDEERFTLAAALGPHMMVGPDSKLAATVEVIVAAHVAARLAPLRALADKARPTLKYACECGFQDDPPPAGHVCDAKVLGWNLDPQAVIDTLGEDTPAGVWVVYSWDVGPYVISIHANEVDALRAVNEQGYGTAKLVPFGANFQETTR